MDQVVARYVDLFAKLEERSREIDPKTKQPRRPLAEPEWESLRLAVFGPGGIADHPRRRPRFVLDRPERQRYTELDNAVKQLEAKSAGKAGRAMVMHDAPKPIEPHVFIRGNPGRPGKPVPRQFLKVLAGPDRKPFQKGSGRLELAQAIVDPRNPLTARVLVNRVWHWHFGQGLVTTPSDFGLRSDPPSHPELLDDLAAIVHRRRLVDQVAAPADHALEHVSAAQRPPPDVPERDPQNRLLWRFNRQRLDFETLRDSVLAVAGTLDLHHGRPVRADQRAAVPPPPDASTASSTARTSTASTAPSTSPCPTPPAPSGSSPPCPSRPSSS